MADQTPPLAWPASVTRALDAIADRWTSLILRDAFIGPCRFDELQRSLGISRHTLTRRLSDLLERGLLERRRYQQRPDRYEYVLTEKGGELYGIFVVLKRWGDRWLAEDGDTELHLWHRPCGHHVHGQVVCEHCGGELRAVDMDYAVKPAEGRPSRRRSKSGGIPATPRRSKAAGVAFECKASQP